MNGLKLMSSPVDEDADDDDDCNEDDDGDEMSYMNSKCCIAVEPKYTSSAFTSQIDLKVNFEPCCC